MVSASTHVFAAAYGLGWGVECRVGWIGHRASHTHKCLVAPAAYVGVIAGRLQEKGGCRKRAYQTWCVVHDQQDRHLAESSLAQEDTLQESQSFA
jgi:hypothetical protein